MRKPAQKVGLWPGAPESRTNKATSTGGLFFCAVRQAGTNTERPLRLTSPIASGWSKNHRVGLSPFEKLHLIAAHTHTSHSGRWLLLSSERFQYIPLPDNHYQRNV
jgi:hypothetical protein